MTFTIILAAAPAAQSPTPTAKGPKTDAELRAMMREINARVAKDAAQRMRDKARAAAVANAEPRKPAAAPSTGGKTWRESQNYSIPVPMDRKSILRRQVAEQERAQAEAARRYQIEAQAQYERMLPYMLEQQRQEFNRMSQMERNAIAQQNAETYRRSMQALEWDMMRRPR